MKETRSISTALKTSLFKFFFLTLLLGWSCPVQAANHPGEKITRAVWNIHSKFTTGTAWAVGPYHVITNAHVFKDLAKAARILLSQKGGSSPLPIERAVRISTTYDLVLLKTRERMAYHLPIASGFSRSRDEPLYAIGYPKEFFQIAEQSAGMTYENHFSYMIPVNKHVLPGFSGAPFLNSKGEVVAVSHSSSSNMADAVKREHLEEFMNLIGRIGVSCENLDSHTQCLEKGVKKTIKDANGKGEVAALAQFQLGRPEGYFIDIIPTKRSKKDWLRLSARRGFPVAAQILGKALRKTKPEEAAYWLRRAAEKGSPLAKFDLGMIHYDRNEARESFHMMKQAGEAGSSTAQYNLGITHFQGWGKAIPRNLGKARYWIERAAGNGHSKAREFLEKHFK